MRRYSPLPLESLLPLLAAPGCRVLLDTSLPDSQNRFSYLFLDPVDVIQATAVGQVRPALERLRLATERDSLWTAGWLAYEAGYALEHVPGALPALPGNAPLVWFGLFERAYIFNHCNGTWLDRRTPDTGRAAAPGQWKVDGLELDCDRERFSADVESIRQQIAAGRTYQVNYTRRWNFAFDGAPADFYQALREAQPVQYSAYISAGDTHLLSLSPELFFRVSVDGEIVTRPMKGTTVRGLDSAHDRRLAAALRHDRKNRAENLMIVDLLRNDLGRICRTGSVQVPRLFEVERYRSVQQMTSTVSGSLRPDVGIDQALAAIFPSGSVTGAPKISTMEIIRSLEDTPRGAYTGAIGFAAPDGSSCFNVAIRTLELRDGRGMLGTGCGIVADSRGDDEYDECRLKARFLTTLPVTAADGGFRLIETMLATGGRIELLEFHLDRLRNSSRYFARPFDRRSVRQKVQAVICGRQERLKVRLLLDCRGECSIECSPFTPPDTPVKIAFWPEAVDSAGEFFRHKTTHRALYDRARKEVSQLGLFDFIFVNSGGNVTEGSICNIYLERKGVLFTPPLRCGVLPGVYRRYLKCRSKFPVRDRMLTAADLRTAGRLWVSNAVTGLLAAELIE